MPVLDVISAGAQTALNTTRNNKIGIIATNTTDSSNACARHPPKTPTRSCAHERRRCSCRWWKKAGSTTK